MKKYLAVYEKIRSDIVAGAIPYKSKLPSKRAIASMMNVSLVTVEHAYEILQSEGYVESRERSGYYVEYTADASFYTAEPESVRTVPPSRPAATDEQFPFSVYAAAVRSVVSERGESLLKKTPNTGLSECKTAIANYLRRNRNIRVETEQIILGSGAEYLYGMAIELLGTDRIYGIETPSYEKIERVYAARGVHYESLPLCRDGISSSALQATCANVLHVTPYRSYPTGVSATASKMREYLHWAETRNGYVIEDDYESEFSLTAKAADTVFGEDETGRVLYINTFSKTICPSLRVGYMLLPRPLVPVFYERLGFYSCTVPVLEQFLIAKLLSNGSFERHINRIRRLRRSENPDGKSRAK